MAFIYSKIIKLKLSELKGPKRNRIINLMSNDTMRLEEAYQNLHFIWASTLLMITSFFVCVYMLNFWSAVAGFSLIFLLAPFSFLFSKKMQSLKRVIIEITDKRVGSTTESLNCMEEIKLNVLEDYFLEKILDIRKKEMKQIKMFQIYKALNTFLNFFFVPGLTSISFITFVSLGGELTPPTAFATLSLLSNLKSTFTQLNQVVVSLIEAKVSLGKKKKLYICYNLTDFFILTGRIETFLNSEEKDGIPSTQMEDIAVSIENGNFMWRKEQIIEQLQKEDIKLKKERKILKNEKVNKKSTDFYLSSVDIKVKKGELVFIVGKVGCGKVKSSFSIIFFLHLKFFKNNRAL